MRKNIFQVIMAAAAAVVQAAAAAVTQAAVAVRAAQAAAAVMQAAVTTVETMGNRICRMAAALSWSKITDSGKKEPAGDGFAKKQWRVKTVSQR